MTKCPTQCPFRSFITIFHTIELGQRLLGTTKSLIPCPFESLVTILHPIALGKITLLTMKNGIHWILSNCSKLNYFIISFLAVSYQPSAISSVVLWLTADGWLLTANYSCLLCKLILLIYLIHYCVTTMVIERLPFARRCLFSQHTYLVVIQRFPFHRFLGSGWFVQGC